MQFDFRNDFSVNINTLALEVGNTGQKMSEEESR